MIEDINIKKIRQIKRDAQNIIKEVILKTEKETGCQCESLEFNWADLEDPENNDFNVDLKLLITLEEEQ